MQCAPAHQNGPGPAGSREMNRSAGSNQGLWPTDWTRAGLETTPARSCGTMGGRGTGRFGGVYIVLYRGPRKFCHYPTPPLCCPQRPGGPPLVLGGPVGTPSWVPSAPGPRRIILQSQSQLQLQFCIIAIFIIILILRQQHCEQEI